MIETASPGSPGSPRPSGSAGLPGAASATSGAGGLSGRAVIVLISVVTIAVAMVSAATGHGFGIVFDVVYFVVTVYAALRVHIEDRFTAIVAPPLIYFVALVAGGYVDSTETEHTWKRVIENTFVNLSFGAPWLVGATVAAVVIVLVRGRRATVARHR